MVWAEDGKKVCKMHCKIFLIKLIFFKNINQKINKIRSQWIDDIPPEIYEILEKIQKSPELQRIIVENYQLDDSPYDAYYKNIQTRSKVFSPRYVVKKKSKSADH